MSKINKSLLVGLIIGAFVISQGCRAQNSVKDEVYSNSKTPTANSQKEQPNQSVVIGADNYSGADKLAKFEEAAKRNSKDAKAQFDAGVSSYVNKDNEKAIKYYKLAIENDPSNAVAYNNLGNVYFRGLNKPKDALQYYEKATRINPAFAYGWLNLALCNKDLGSLDAAKQAVKESLTRVAVTDQLYKSLQELGKTLEQTKK